MDASTLIALLALVISFVSAWYAYLQYVAAKIQVKHEISRSIRTWGDEVLTVMGKGQVLVELAADAEAFEAVRKPMFGELSALIERGRLLFPNINKGDGYGDDKEEAYRGYRPLVLDFLVEYFDALKAANPANIAEAGIEELKKDQRLFVSEFQKILDPMGNYSELRKTLHYNMEQKRTIHDHPLKRPAKTRKSQNLAGV
jgi:hypothetical protein